MWYRIFPNENPLNPVVSGEGRCCVRYLLCVMESTAVIQILQKDYSGCLVFIPDKSQSEQWFTASSSLHSFAPSHPVDDSEDFFLLGFLHPDAVKCLPHTAVWANERGVIDP